MSEKKEKKKGSLLRYVQVFTGGHCRFSYMKRARSCRSECGTGREKEKDLGDEEQQHKEQEM